MTETNNREVNADVEEVEVADEVEETEEGDETVIPPVEDTPEGAVPAEGNEATEEPTESSPEGSEETESQEEVPSTLTKKEPVPVIGETPKEKALRLEIQRVKTLLREKSISDMTGNNPAPKSADDLQQLRDIGYSDEEISNMEKAIDVIAQKKGYVKAEQSYQATVNTIVESFIDSHPEYKPENDPEDVRWTRFEGIIKSGVYNLSGKTPKQLNEIFKRVHRDVTEELGEADVTVEVKRQAAQVQKIKSVNHSGGTKPASVKKTANIDPNVRSMFKGFDDDDLE